MDYGLLPPEVNSARMYAGAGPGSLLAAVGAWGGLAADLHSTAIAYQSVISELVGGPWQGRTSLALAAASAPYVAWLENSSAHAEVAAAQASAAVAAYETAFAMTVPPPVVAANRALLSALVATNLLGQNTPAIATTEAEYLEFWTQDAIAMYGYAGSTAAATQLSDFEEPTEVAKPSGLAEQGVALAKATANSIQTGAQDALSKAVEAIPNTLKALSLPVMPKITDDLVSWYGKYVGVFMPAATASSQLTNASIATTTFLKGLAPAATAAAKAAENGAQALGAAATQMATRVGATTAGAGATLARALPVGGLSVPASWAAAVPSSHAAAMSTGLTVPSAVASGLGGLPVAPLGPLMTGNGSLRNAIPRYGFHPAVMARPPAAG